MLKKFTIFKIKAIFDLKKTFIKYKYEDMQIMSKINSVPTENASFARFTLKGKAEDIAAKNNAWLNILSLKKRNAGEKIA